MTSDRVVVTGGAGFIGSHLVGRLLELGYGVRVIDSLITGRRSNLADYEGDYELIEGDIRDPDLVMRAVADCDVVFHQAALGSVPRSIADPVASLSTNVMGTLNVLMAAKEAGVRRLVAASSSSIYGANETLPKHEGLEPLPMSPYATSKLASEGLYRSYAVVHGMDTVALRYFNVYGPRQDPTSHYAAVIPMFCAAMLSGHPAKINGDGLQSRAFTYVTDVVSANLAAATAPGVGGKKYNVAGDRQITLLELHTEMAALLSVAVAPEHGPARSGDVRHSFASVERAERDLGWKPIVSLREGLRATVGHLSQELAPNFAA